MDRVAFESLSRILQGLRCNPQACSIFSVHATHGTATMRKRGIGLPHPLAGGRLVFVDRVLRYVVRNPR
jgi:hypothetical protein